MWLIFVALFGVIGVLIYRFFLKTDKDNIGITNILATQGNDASVYSHISSYQEFFQHKKTSMLKDGDGAEHESVGKVDERKTHYEQVVNKYYNLVTDFYEYGWGKSFHFACRFKGETLKESIKRHEHYLSSKMGLNESMHVLDVGCGVGGPLMEIAQFSGCKITGLNNNNYQVNRGLHHIQQAGLHDCSMVKGDFMDIPFKEEAFDAAYTIEACCHAPSRVGVFSEVYRTLKPGGVFAGYEWVMKDAFDPTNKEHVTIKKGIELGNGLPDLAESPKVVIDALLEAGFEIIYQEDRSKLKRLTDIAWYAPLAGNWSLSNFRATKLGQWVTHIMLIALETLKVTPKGTVDTHLVLAEGADKLVKGGSMDLFTPMFLFVARKAL